MGVDRLLLLLHPDSRIRGVLPVHPPPVLLSIQQKIQGDLKSEPDTSAPPPFFDPPPSRSVGGVLSDGSANAERSKDAWAELEICHTQS